MTPTYASSRLKLPTSAFSLANIPGTTTAAIANTYNFCIQSENRTGRNFLSDSQSIAVAAGQGVAVTINSNAIQTGEDPFWITISLQTTGNDVDAVIVARFKTKDDGQVNFNPLPATINLTTDEHFTKARTANDFAALPTSGILDGAVAQTIDNGLYWRYDSTTVTDVDGYKSYGDLVEGANNWVRYYGTNLAIVTDTELVGGSNIQLAAVLNALRSPPKKGDADSVPIKFYLNNGFEDDGQSSTLNGGFTFSVTINGESYENTFAERIKYRLLGYVDKATGILDTTIDTVGDTQTWSPTSPGKYPADIPRNHAALYEVWLSYTEAQIKGFLPNGNPEFRINILPTGQNQSRLSKFANAQGDLAFSDGGKLLIVPGPKRLSGFGTIEMPGEYGYEISTDLEQPVTGLLPNTASQVAAIAGVLNGFVRIAQDGNTLNESEKIRAKISTEAGLSNLSVSGSVAIANTGIQITVTHPVNATGRGIVRSDYPDPLIAGNEQGNFTPTEGYHVVNYNGTILQSPVVAIATATTQTFNYSDFSGWTTLGTLPVQSDAAFSLFEAVDIAPTGTGTGTINGNVTAYFGYNYPTTNTKATKISHDIDDGAIPTLTLPVGAILGQLGELAVHVGRTDNPHQVTHEQTGGEAVTDAQAIAIASNTSNIQTNTNAIQLNTTARTNLGTAANKDFGTAAGQLVELGVVGINAALPAVDGSQLTGINALSDIQFVSGTFVSEATLPPKHYLIATAAAVAATTLPPSPTDKSRVSYSDRDNSFAVNSATITAGTGNTVDGQADIVLSTEGQALTLVYDAANTNWVVINGIQSVATTAASGDMDKDTYDPNDDGSVLKADAINGIDTAGNLKFYATDGSGAGGFYDIGVLVKAALEALVDPNKLLGSAIANARDIGNSPIDDYCITYDLETNLWVYRPRIQLAGAGVILNYISQSLFKAANGTLATAYTPERGDPIFTDVKILTTAGVPDNQIQNEQLQVNVTNTGAVLDLGVSDTVFRVNWVYNSTDNLGILCRWESDGNMVIVDFSGTAIAVKTIINDVITTVSTTGFAFTNGTNYKLDVQVLGVQYKVLVDDVEAIAEVLSDEFLTATSFGIGRLN